MNEYHLTIQNYIYTDTKNIFHKYEITVSGISLVSENVVEYQGLSDEETNAVCELGVIRWTISLFGLV